MERKGRDNFKQSVLKILCRRAGGKCCKCGAITQGPVKNRPTESVNIGKGAHIAAAAPGGPRYDPKMNAEERSSASNGMWLCSNCHDTIDRDEATYPTSVLKQIKRDAEDRVRKELGVATILQATVNSGSSELITGISAAAILEIRRAKTKFLTLCSDDTNEKEELADNVLEEVSFLDFEQDEYAIEVGEELLMMLREVVFHCIAKGISMEVIRLIQPIADCFNSQWKEPQIKLVCQIVERALKVIRNKRSKAYQSGLALLRHLSSYKALEENKLNKIPLNMIKKMCGRDEVDADIQPPTNKRPRISEEEDDQHDSLMREWADSTDPEQRLKIESQMGELGYELDVV